MKYDPLKLRTIDLWSYTTPAIQEMLQSFGLSTKGRNKDELIERLNAHIFQSRFDPKPARKPVASKQAQIQIIDDHFLLQFPSGRTTRIELSAKNALGLLQNALFEVDMRVNLWSGSHEPTRPAPGGKRPTTLDDLA